MSEPVVIYSAANTPQAYLLKGLLEEEGIAACVVNDSIQVAGGELPLGWTAAPRVVVDVEHEAAARKFAEEFDSRLIHGPATDVLNDEPPTVTADWPLCPQCGEGRAARCPVCKFSGADFPLADFQAGEDERWLLYCASCDDNFIPEWYRLCARCGHDFGDGIEMTPQTSAGSFARIAQLMIAMAIGVCVFAFYFAWLFRG